MGMGGEGGKRNVNHKPLTLIDLAFITPFKKI